MGSTCLHASCLSLDAITLITSLVAWAMGVLFESARSAAAADGSTRSSGRTNLYSETARRRFTCSRIELSPLFGSGVALPCVNILYGPELPEKDSTISVDTWQLDEMAGHIIDCPEQRSSQTEAIPANEDA